ncbi:putative selenium-dependent hydroxylase accessory protein YqeC [Desulfosporosinus acidiphilus SJ4]|uniref:Putative selenium-dependent hydroxylase accessory protein YqeC n=1 Tax=Desulfosporosinus acidiphilus (strain DSM 22704 / JCM 16185 / SJ4) TaxID=646529 RepID=I4D5F7_DESAJ|nr:selenium cofactor biosynthesis protein YqeC [Desulfosporosinus acidiphilus]AFM41031.1 putative selenium-dependent hydroxylase accessory protein YqeC [Desulfosporosinus acidiphilus SJ4]
MAKLSNDSQINWAGGSLWEMTKQARVITLIGAGGKTTCLQTLTQEIHAAGFPVIATTTTKVYPERHLKPWLHSMPPPFASKTAYFWYSGAEERSGKWLGHSLSAVDDAVLGDVDGPITHSNDHPGRRHWIIEGDGARERRLKCWAGHEPQIPLQSDCGVLVVDGRLWGQELKPEDVHRAECCPDLFNNQWTEESAWRYFRKSPVFYPQYQHLAWVILLNIHDQPDPIKIKSFEESIFPEMENQAGLPELKDLVVLLEALYRRGVEEVFSKAPETKPRSLRIAAGDAKGGKLLWFDLW